MRGAIEVIQAALSHLGESAAQLARLIHKGITVHKGITEPTR